MKPLTKNTLEAYKQDINAQIKEMRAKVLQLEATMGKSSADLRREYGSVVENLKKKSDDVQKQLDQFSTSAEDTWQQIQTRIDQSLNELRGAIKSATEQITQQ